MAEEQDTIDPVEFEVQALRERYTELRDQLEQLQNKVEITSPIEIQDAIDNLADELRAEMGAPITFFNHGDVNVLSSGLNTYDVYRDDQSYFKASSYNDSGTYKMKIRMGVWQHNGTVLSGSAIGAGAGTNVWDLDGITLYAAPVGALDAGASAFKIGTLAEHAIDGTTHVGYAVKLCTGTLGGSNDQPQIVQEHLGSIITASAYPDSDTYFSSVAPTQNTIEWKPSTPVDDAHNGELQIYGADNQTNAFTVEDQYSIPYLQRQNSDGDTEIEWIPMDADSGGCDAGGYKSLQIDLAHSVWQLYGFNGATSVLPATTDLLVMKDISEETITYVNVSHFLSANAKEIWNTIATELNNQTADWTLLLHCKLDFDPDDDGVAGINYDHAYSHPCIGDTWEGGKAMLPGAGGNVGGVWFQSIGRGTDNGAGSPDSMAIDLLYSTLLRRDAGVDYITVNWENTFLYQSVGSAQGNVVLDWTLLKTYKSDGTTQTIDWGNQVLYDGATSCANWDSTSVDISATPVFKVLNVTAPGSGAGAIQCSGGAYLAKGLYSNRGGGTQSAYHTDGTRIAQLVTAALAGSFTDGTRTVELANASYAVGVTAGDINIPTSSAYKVNGTQVLTDQQAAEADIADTSGTDSDGTCRAKLNALLAKLRTHGIIAT